MSKSQRIVRVIARRLAERLEKQRIRGRSLDKMADYLDAQLDRINREYREIVLRMINKIQTV